ncbi:MAG: ABC transporter permease [Gemmatimonadales bacterium]
MLTRLRAWLRRLRQGSAAERELGDELRSYLDHLTDEKIAAGMAPDAARRAARLEAGALDDAAERVRETRAGAWLDRMLRDLRYAARSFRRTPGFTALALATLALGIGGNAVVFSLVNAVLFRPLPYPEPDRLVMVMEAPADGSEDFYIVAGPNYRDWTRLTTSFEGMALYEYLPFNLSGTTEPEAVGGLRTTSGLFEALGVVPALGRGLLPSDDVPGAAKVVVLSDRLWRRRYGADSGLVGGTVRINQEPHTVVGVMPRGFAFPTTSEDVWVAMGEAPEDQSRGSHSFFAMGRLADGVGLSDALAEMRAIGDRLREEYPVANRGETATVIPMADFWTKELRGTFGLLFLAVGLVLLIACANVANLLIARGATRHRELAVRLALGGSRRAVQAQLLTESGLLALLGSALGLALAWATIPILLQVLPPGIRNVPFRDLGTISLDWWVVAFTALIGVTTALLSGLVPTLQVLPASAGQVLKDGEARGATARGGHRLRKGLVSAEVALALVVLAAAGLLIGSMRRMLEVEPGFVPERAMSLQVQLPQPDFYGPAVRTTFCDEVTTQVAGIAGVTAVSAVSMVPLGGANATRGFVVEGEPEPAPGAAPSANYGVACAGHLAALGIRLVEGREFSSSDRAGTPDVAIINQEAARRYFPSGDAVGRRIKLGRFDSSAPWMTVVGVSADVRHLGLNRPISPYLFRPYTQAAWPWMNVIVRADGDPMPLAQPVRAALSKIGPEQPIKEAVPLTTVVERSVGALRFPMLLFTAFALMAIALAALGIAGVAAQTVAQRTREFGIRRAVGATTLELYRLVIGGALGPVVVGLVVGVVGGVAATRLLRGLLYGIAPTDVRTFVAVAALLALVGVAASLLPARRAASLDPAVVLRDE